MKVARVKCGGGESVCKKIYDYIGIHDCMAVKLMHGGQYSCSHSCEGLGNCVRACDFDAIFIIDGVAGIIASRCTACGKCAKACPKKLIDIVPAESRYTVRCSNRDKGSIVMKACAVGCIGCSRCVKVCGHEAVIVENNLAIIDPHKCVNCGECEKVCPTKCIQCYDCASAKTKTG